MVIILDGIVYLCSIFNESNTFLMFFFLRIRRPPRSTQSRSSAASDVYKRQGHTVTKEDVQRTLLYAVCCDGLAGEDWLVDGGFTKW